MWFDEVNIVSTKAKHVIWWSQYCEHQGLACEADEDCLMKDLLEPGPELFKWRLCANMKMVGWLGLGP